MSSADGTLQIDGLRSGRGCAKMSSADLEDSSDCLLERPVVQLSFWRGGGDAKTRFALPLHDELVRDGPRDASGEDALDESGVAEKGEDADFATARSMDHSDGDLAWAFAGSTSSAVAPSLQALAGRRSHLSLWLGEDEGVQMTMSEQHARQDQISFRGMEHPVFPHTVGQFTSRSTLPPSGL